MLLEDNLKDFLGYEGGGEMLATSALEVGDPFRMMMHSDAHYRLEKVPVIVESIDIIPQCILLRCCDPDGLLNIELWS